MCDTFVAGPEHTLDGATLFAKNSDREPGEAQAVELVPGGEHAAGSRVRCTYVDVPAVARTHDVLICRPFWIWGAEMGVSSAGVAIGNEAVFTRVRPGPKALLGMDLVRLALERASSARVAVDVITSLLETHGQGGPADLAGGFRYDNSFLVADAAEAWVIETAGRAWVAQRVRRLRAISNGLSIADDWDLACDGLAARARDAGLAPGKGRVDFARTFADPLVTFAAHARARRGSNEAHCAHHRGRMTPLTAMAALRRHGPGDRPERSAGRLFMTVCGHASWQPTRTHAQTTGSLVVQLGERGPVAFVTATSAPCTSTFKPIWLDAGLPPGLVSPSARFDAAAAWWRHERVHRAALADLGARLSELAPERDALERELVERALAARSADRHAETARGFAAAEALDATWLERWSALPKRLPGPLFRRYWAEIDRRSGLAYAG